MMLIVTGLDCRRRCHRHSSSWYRLLSHSFCASIAIWTVHRWASIEMVMCISHSMAHRHKQGIERPHHLTYQQQVNKHQHKHKHNPHSRATGSWSCLCGPYDTLTAYRCCVSNETKREFSVDLTISCCLDLHFCRMDFRIWNRWLIELKSYFVFHSYDFQAHCLL